MNVQNIANFVERPRMPGGHPSDVAFALAQRRAQGTGLSYNFAKAARASSYRGTSGLTDDVAAQVGSTSGGSTSSGGGLSAGEAASLAGTLAGAVASAAVGIYSTSVAQQQARQQADLQKKLLDLQKNQQSIDAYKLLASQQGRDVASGVTPGGDGGGVLNGSAAIMAVVALGALFLLK